MKRRILCGLLCLMLVLALLPAAASAKGNNGNQCVSNGQYPAHNNSAKKLEKMVESANKKIDHLVKKAQKTPQNDVDQMLRQIDRIVYEVFAYADRIGAELACDYVGYIIDGQYVLIDPIRIVRL